MLENVQEQLKAAISAYGNARNLEEAARAAWSVSGCADADLEEQLRHRRADSLECFKAFRRVVVGAEPNLAPAFDCVARGLAEPAYEGAIPWIDMDGLAFGLNARALVEHRAKLALAEALAALHPEPELIIREEDFTRHG